MTEQAADSPVAEAAAQPPSEKDSTVLERQLAALRARYTDNHPDVKAVREAVAMAKEREAGAAASPAGPVAPPRPEPRATAAGDAGKLLLNSAVLRERERVEQVKTMQVIAVKQLEDLESERGRVLRELAAAQARFQQLPIREQQIAGLARDYEISKLNYQSLLDKKLAAQMSTEMEKNQKSERFTILDSARVPEKPVKPDRVLLSIAVWVAALFLSVVAGFLVEFQTNVVLGEWELPEGTPILGRVPCIEMSQAAGDVPLGLSRKACPQSGPPEF
jgi:uncharacterized protein involved in exopolysaccharide biosynthesis